jgi:hypothetical protein
MAPTYELIASNTLSSSAAEVIFSAIPATYTDLLVKVSARNDISGQVNSLLTMRLNADTASNYSRTRLYASGTFGAFSERNSNQGNQTDVSFFNGPAATSNTFGNAEIYIPNYVATTAKSVSGNSAVENNSASDASVGAHAYLYRGTAAITTIRFNIVSGNFVSGSSFFLYGINNS